jgi:hypothetical protein
MALMSVRSFVLEELQAHGPVEQHHFGEGADAGVNLILRLPGQRPELAPVLVAAHYDGPLGSPGADDNATGLAALLELCRLDRQGLAGEMACGAREPGLVARYRGPSTTAARSWFTRIWYRIRAARGLAAPELPRVWPFQEEPLPTPAH